MIALFGYALLALGISRVLRASDPQQVYAGVAAATIGAVIAVIGHSLGSI